MLFSKLNCHKGFNLILFSYIISVVSQETWLRLAVLDLRYRVYVWGFRVQGPEPRVQGSGCKGQGLIDF